jgi:5-methylcytosine-specific restriction endonuclease McrA
VGKLHSTYAWQKRRAQQLRDEPLCRLCRDVHGRVTAATVADHVVPHRSDPVLFAEGALQSLCSTCHNSLKAQQEKSGTFRGCDAQGYPLDPAHWWRKQRAR